MLGPEWETLHAALEQLHSRILYEAVGIEHVGYDDALFRLAAKVPGNRTLADILVWILEAGGELRAVQIRAGEYVGPTLSREQLRARWESLDPGDLGLVHTSEAAAARVLRGLLGITDINI
jgi:hypothetical protein